MHCSVRSAARPPACVSALPAATGRPSRRQFLRQLLRVGAATAGTSALGSLLSHDDHEHEHDLELQSILEAAPASQQEQHVQMQPAAPPARRVARSRGSRPTLATPSTAQPQAPAPRVLALHNIAELAHLLACHPDRLLVVHFAASSCPLGEAFLPLFTDACRRYPAALFLRIVLQPDQAAQAVSQEVLQGLRIGRLPCTLLLHGQQLLARLEVRTAGSSSSTEEPPEALVAAAARTLHAAVGAALLPPPAAAEDEEVGAEQPQHAATAAAAAPAFNFAATT